MQCVVCVGRVANCCAVAADGLELESDNATTKGRYEHIIFLEHTPE